MILNLSTFQNKCTENDVAQTFENKCTEYLQLKQKKMIHEFNYRIISYLRSSPIRFKQIEN